MLSGVILCGLWYYTIVAGFYTLYCPVMYIMFFNQLLYRNIVDFLFVLWELYPVALFQCLYNTELHHYGDYVNPHEKTLIILNHRTRVDWNYVWIALYHATQTYVSDSDNYFEEKSKTYQNIFSTSKIKIVLKDEIKNIPGMGWIMQLNFFLYLKRNWREDQLNLLKFVDYYGKLDYKYRLVLFPEGTDLSDNNRRRSERYAFVNNLQRYEYVLHPRTTGFAALCTRLRNIGLDSIYDISIAYDQPAQTELELLCGKIPKCAYFYFKRYSIDEIPVSEEDVKIWLQDRWREKEELIRNFNRNNVFLDAGSTKPAIKRAPRNLKAAKLGFVFWTFIDLIFVHLLLMSPVFQFWVVYHSLLFIFCTWYFGGFHNIQHKLLNKQKPI